MRVGILMLAIASSGCQLLFPLGDDDVIGDDDVPPAADIWTAPVAGFGHTCGLDDQERLFCWGRNIDGELGRPGDPALEAKGLVSGRWATVTSYGNEFTAHMCGIQTDGTAWCWGANQVGQLGTGATSGDQSAPVEVQIGVGIAALAPGGRHTCALDVDGGLWCWGSNEAGQLGDGTKLNRASAQLVMEGKTWLAVAAGAIATCAIDSERALWCWGRVFGTNGVTPTPIMIAGDNTWQRIAIGSEHACGITDDGAMKCIGVNTRGQLGNPGSTSPQLVDVLVDGEARMDWTEVSANHEHTCGIAGGEWWCWGSSVTGQLGRDGGAVNSSPVQLGADRTWQRVASGFGHNCAVATDQTMWCVGRRGFGELGNGSSSPKVPTKIDGTWKSVDLGWSHVCAIDLADRVHCAGANGFGLLGVGTSDGKRAFAGISDSGTYASISSGAFHTCGVRTDDMVVCWGANYTGQVMPGTAGNFLNPTPITTGIAVSAAGEHTCTIANDSKLFCWGRNAKGQLGNGDPTKLGPTEVAGGPWASVRVGEVHTCAINAAGNAFCWGSGVDGRTGNANANSNPTLGPAFDINATPLAVSTMATVSALAMGDGTTCASVGLPSNAVQCWGSNYGGEIGNGISSSKLTPISIGAWEAIAIGTSHGCGIQGGVLKCWGTNQRGQLGIDSLIEAPTPTPVTPVDPTATWVSVDAGEDFTCAIDSNSAMYCWGDNGFGQIPNLTAWQLDLVQVSGAE
jgi:alpha-tubulin suppressor-like RCC1 family protein